MNLEEHAEESRARLEAVGAMPLVTEMNDAIDVYGKQFYKMCSEMMKEVGAKFDSISFAAGFFWGCIAMFKEGDLREKVFACQRYIKKVSEEIENGPTQS